MTPYTFQVYGIQGQVGSTDDQKLNFGAAYVDKIKPRTSEEFVSMSTYAGAPAGVDRGVYVTGANYIAGQLSIGASEYYCADIINILYPEVKYTIPLADRVRLLFHAQYTDQHSTGDALLTGTSFSAHQSGFRPNAIGTALLTVARTITALGTVNASGSGTSMRNPWGSYPGYTASQIENFDRAGEDATMLRAAYNFPRKTGLSIYGLWVMFRPRASSMNTHKTSMTPIWSGVRRALTDSGYSLAMRTSRRRDRPTSTRTSCGSLFTTSCAEIRSDGHFVHRTKY